MAQYELLDVKRSVLVVIDYQGKLMDMVYRPPLMIAAAKRLIKLAGIFDVPIVLTEQLPDKLGATHAEIRAEYDAVDTRKAQVSKSSFGCCGEPKFMQALDEVLPAVPAGQRQVLLCGIEAHVCVTQTAVELLRQGYQVFASWDAISCRGQEYYKHALKRMRQAGAVLTNNESVAFEWARDAVHPQFKAVNTLLREGQLV